MFWDRVAGVYDLFVNVYNRKAHHELCHMIKELIEPEDEVLECACGTGMLTVGIAERCKLLVASDFSSEMISKARKKCTEFSNITFEQADILDLPYPDESFDKVIAANVIHLLDDPNKALSELNRVCKTDGILIIPTYMNKEKTGEASGFSKAIGKAGADFKRQFTFSSYPRFFKDAGYTVVDCQLIEGRVPCAVAQIKRK